MRWLPNSRGPAFVVTFLLAASQGLAQNAVSLTKGDVTCPPGERLVSVSYAKEHGAKLCAQIPDFAIVRLAGLGSLSGHGLNCQILRSDPRPLKLSLCAAKIPSSRIRGVLLRAGFSSQEELNYMSQSDWRSALEVELANRTAAQQSDYVSLSDDDLADVGEMLAFFLRSSNVSAQMLAKMGLAELRQALAHELAIQTGQPPDALAHRPLRALLDLLEQG